ncbi:MAG: LPXTG cell wall anchor domain-containing protein, partial [Streptococcus sanguinis]
QNGQNGRTNIDTRPGAGTTPRISNNRVTGTPTPSTLAYSSSDKNTDGVATVNRLAKELPQTGEESSMNLSLLGGATILGLLGAVQIRRKRYGQD